MDIIKKLYICLIFLTITGCKSQEISITEDYIFQSEWRSSANPIFIYEMTAKDGFEVKNFENINKAALFQGLEKNKDNSYMAKVSFVDKIYSNRKVFFNRENDFKWCSLSNMNSRCTVDTVGKLKNKTWYMISGIDNNKTLYYLYLDSNNVLSTISIPASMWTNY